MSEQKKSEEKLMTPTEGITTLGTNQFALQLGATFKFNDAGTIVKIDDTNGNISVTLNFTLNKCATCALRTSGDISDIDSVVFIKKSTNSLLLGGGSAVSKLTLDKDTTTGQFSLGTDQGDVYLITNGEKGRQGGH